MHLFYKADEDYLCTNTFIFLNQQADCHEAFCGHSMPSEATLTL